MLAVQPNIKIKQMTNENVLMVIDKNDILIHVGEPETFDKALIVEYAMTGLTIKTLSFEEWEQSGYKLYKKIK